MIDWCLLSAAQGFWKSVQDSVCSVIYIAQSYIIEKSENCNLLFEHWISLCFMCNGAQRSVRKKKSRAEFDEPNACLDIYNVPMTCSSALQLNACASGLADR